MKTAELRRARLLELVRDLISFGYRQYFALHHRGVTA